jgi:hypothetical protein
MNKDSLCHVAKGVNLLNIFICRLVAQVIITGPSIKSSANQGSGVLAARLAGLQRPIGGDLNPSHLFEITFPQY